MPEKENPLKKKNTKQKKSKVKKKNGNNLYREQLTT